MLSCLILKYYSATTYENRINNVSTADLVIEQGQHLATFEILCALQSVNTEGIFNDTDTESEKKLKVSLFDLEDTSLSATQKLMVKEFLRKHHSVIGNTK